ncbi:indigoidine synthase A-like protein [Rhizopus microsporus var. microsporus]|uniref:Pseudouridine-5'-phosphate glycosidase n=2 Tax=Rhizopus microsporus TaxID=58291 RepID=A0A2G4T858_RHIZD|nr:pseudouridine-5'-phosphate glycosidase [Rhizopus microsporus ATCC 52813]ORE10945.1 indigoidine synthase A-like protein [Rhizopus microsporus var. microsporus]PHZ16856.1 pseudouridine-5'-phosphate glycosidase [Rhizopus microsporus ATCC 52813]
MLWTKQYALFTRLGIRRFSALSIAEKFTITPEIKDALKRNGPVVALESTIISHGMPYPQNVETARSVEAIVREQGAIPATIAILNGKVHIGLNDDQLDYFGKNGPAAIKASRRDLPVVLAQGKSGATTVASTMILARAAGISVFVTGGIGGVHRGASESFDISADLTELGRTPVAVVCAGVKSILDIPKTLEVLETQGVTVATIGTTRQFPAFYTANSGFDSPYHVETAQDAAKIILANHELQMNSGVVFAVPIPKESAADTKSIQEAIDTAIAEARAENIKGKEETPFLLKRITELTKGESLSANIALVKNNAKIGGQIAVKLSQLNQQI